MHQVEVVGTLADVRFPNMCASCGEAPPHGDVAIEKMFRRAHHDAPSTYVFATVRAPLCRACLIAHERERQPIDPAVLGRLRRMMIVKVLPYLIPMGVQLFFIVQFGPKAIATRSPVWIAVTLFFAALFAGFVRACIHAGRPLIADHQGDPSDTYIETVRGALGNVYVVPVAPTPTLAAVNFTDTATALFAPNHRAFVFAQPMVAEQFAGLNAHLVFDPSAEPVRRQRRAQQVFVWLLVGGAIAMMIYELATGR